jgi:peptide deformylase
LREGRNATHSSLIQEAAATAFGTELRRIRLGRGYSQSALAHELDYDPSYISKLEHGKEPPTRPFAERADEVLQQAGTLVQLWRAYFDANPRKRQAAAEHLDYGVRSDDHAHRSGLVVVHEDSQLVYNDGMYVTTVRRELYNGSDAPIMRYLIRVAVDRHPTASQVSNALYRQQPLTMAELDLAATCGGEEMTWRVEYDRDAFKEIWLQFENPLGKFPLYPGDTATIEYRYAVSADKWGKWWQRAIRVPTERLSAELIFPASLEPMLWGLQTSMFAQRLPVQPAVQRRETPGLVNYTWSTSKPSLHTRIRFEWRFRNEPSQEEPFQLALSERMKRLGIVQRGEPMLTRASAPFSLPAEADLARATGELLITYLDPLAALHTFGKGMGLAAPQIGVPRAAAVVQLPRGRPQVLYNPRIVAVAPESDERFEGCLSFFDVRGSVRRSLAIQVEHTDLRGGRHVSTFQNAAARHWQHEIDHLEGVLYIDRMDDPAAELTPVEEYSEVGDQWNYSESSHDSPSAPESGPAIDGISDRSFHQTLSESDYDVHG